MVSGCLITDGDLAPASLTKKGDGGVALQDLICQDDMAHRCHPVLTW